MRDTALKSYSGRVNARNDQGLCKIWNKGSILMFQKAAIEQIQAIYHVWKFRTGDNPYSKKNVNIF